MRIQTIADDLPPEVLGLGTPVAVYAGNRFLVVICYVVAVLSPASMAGLVIFSFLKNPGEVATGWPFALALLGVPVLPAAFLFYAARTISRLRYAICPDGIAKVRGKQVDTMHWAGLNVYVHFQPTVGSQYCYRLHNGAKKWKVNWEVGGVESFGQAVCQEVARRELPGALDRIERGEEIVFGPVRVNKLAIGSKEQFVPWEEVEGIEILSGHSIMGAKLWLIVTQGSADRRVVQVETHKVPNIALLLQLIGKIRPTVLPAG